MCRFITEFSHNDYRSEAVKIGYTQIRIKDMLQFKELHQCEPQGGLAHGYQE